MKRQSDELFMKNAYPKLKLKPLQMSRDEDRAVYVPIYESIDPNSDGDIDPVKRLKRHIELCGESESLQFISGFSGSGKSTELYRLKDQLEKCDYLVLYADISNYIELNGIIDITDLLLAIVDAFSEQLSSMAVLGKSIGSLDSLGDRINNFISRIKIDPGLKLPIPWIDLKVELKQSPMVRNRVQSMLANHVNKLKNELNDFIKKCTDEVFEYQIKQFGTVRQIVMIIDSLEKIKGAYANDHLILDSIEKLFGNHIDKLGLPNIHVVYTVPPWLKFVAPAHGMIVLSSIKQWDQSPERVRYERGNAALCEVIRRRFPNDEFERLFGDERGIQPLIDVCGGHFRDLFRLVLEAFAQAEELPIPKVAIERAIKKIKRDFPPITIDDAYLLKRIADTRSADPKNPDDIRHLVNLLHKHMILYLANGKEWYDVHPIIRVEVEEIVYRNPIAK